MIQEIRNYVDTLFENAPATFKTLELKEEVTSNLIDKYVDLTKNGVSEEEAYRVAVASVGDISELIEKLSDDRLVDERPGQKKFAMLLTIGIVITILSLLPIIIVEEMGFDNLEGLFGILFIVIAAIGVGIIIYANLSRPKYKKASDSAIDEFKELNSSDSDSFKMTKKQKALYDSLAAILWLIAVTIYMWISFSTSQWQITWVIFLITSALQQVLKAIFVLSSK